jgi:hypothetical protein
MGKYFDYLDKNDIEIFYCNPHSMLIRENDLDKMNRFISKEYRYLMIECRYNKAGAIISQEKLSLEMDDSNTMRNITNV